MDVTSRQFDIDAEIDFRSTKWAGAGDSLPTFSSLRKWGEIQGCISQKYMDVKFEGTRSTKHRDMLLCIISIYHNG